jgi:hypothetical protein
MSIVIGSNFVSNRRNDKYLVTPVALIIFNRPEPTAAVFAAIAAALPAKLLIISDGARPGRAGEAEKVAAVRAIVEAVDWPCDVQTNYAAANMGCKLRVSSGIDWVFSQVERAIILEDDCLPSPAFFRFAEEMLDRYADDRRIYSISGSNFSGSQAADGHYYSNFALMWGWATWRDRWADYDVKPRISAVELLRIWWRHPVSWLYWHKIFCELTSGRIDTWDYQWMLTIWRKGGLTVRPSVNLVQNIGFGADATHTMDTNSQIARMTAWNGKASLAEPLTGVRADRARDAIDAKRWGLISWRSVLLMYFPWLSRTKWTRL